MTASFFVEAESVWIKDLQRDSKSSFAYIDEFRLSLAETKSPWIWTFSLGYLPSQLERKSNSFKSFGILEAFAQKSWTDSFFKIGVDEVDYFEFHQDQFLRTSDLLYFSTQPSPLVRYSHRAFDLTVFEKDLEQINEKGFDGYAVTTRKSIDRTSLSLSYLSGNSILESVRQTRLITTYTDGPWTTRLNVSSTQNQGQSGPVRHGSATAFFVTKTKESFRHLFLFERYRSENLEELPIELSLQLGAEKKFQSGTSVRANLIYKKLDYKDSKDFDEYQGRLTIGYTNSFLEL